MFCFMEIQVMGVPFVDGQNSPISLISCCYAAAFTHWCKSWNQQAVYGFKVILMLYTHFSEENLLMLYACCEYSAVLIFVVQVESRLVAWCCDSLSIIGWVSVVVVMAIRGLQEKHQLVHRLHLQTYLGLDIYFHTYCS